jgi:hypothetical protein
MASISSDTEFRRVLAVPDGQQQRMAAALFVDNPLDMMDDPRVDNALAADSDEGSHDGERRAQYKILSTYLDA